MKCYPDTICSLATLLWFGGDRINKFSEIARVNNIDREKQWYCCELQGVGPNISIPYDFEEFNRLSPGRRVWLLTNYNTSSNISSSKGREEEEREDVV